MAESVVKVTTEQQKIVEKLKEIAQIPPDEWPKARIEIKVVAGPGTGKSTTIVEALEPFYSAESRSFDNVVLPSFCHSTCDEMGAKLQKRFGVSEELVKNLVPTFHSLAKRKFKVGSFTPCQYEYEFRSGADEFHPEVKGWVRGYGLADKHYDAVVKILDIRARKIMKYSWGKFLASDSYFPEVKVSNWERNKVYDLIERRLLPSSDQIDPKHQEEAKQIASQIAAKFQEKAASLIQKLCATYWKLHLVWLKQDALYKGDLNPACQFMSHDGYQKLIQVVLKAVVETGSDEPSKDDDHVVLWKPEHLQRVQGVGVDCVNPAEGLSVYLKGKGNIYCLPTTQEIIRLSDVRTFVKPPCRSKGIVVVDEAQDLNGVQFSLASLLWPERALMMVGDPVQSIYGWRYAFPYKFQKFGRGEKSSVFKLSTSFRFLPIHCDVFNIYLQMVYAKKNEPEENRIELKSARRDSDPRLGKSLLRTGHSVGRLHEDFEEFAKSCHPDRKKVLIIHRSNAAAFGSAPKTLLNFTYFGLACEFGRPGSSGALSTLKPSRSFAPEVLLTQFLHQGPNIDHYESILSHKTSPYFDLTHLT